MCVETSLSMILRKFLFLVEFKPSDFYKNNSYKKTQCIIYDCISSSKKQSVLFIFLDSMTTPFEIKRSLVQSLEIHKKWFW